MTSTNTMEWWSTLVILTYIITSSNQKEASKYHNTRYTIDYFTVPLYIPNVRQFCLSLVSAGDGKPAIPIGHMSQQCTVVNLESTGDESPQHTTPCPWLMEGAGSSQSNNNQPVQCGSPTDKASKLPRRYSRNCYTHRRVRMLHCLVRLTTQGVTDMQTLLI